MCLVTDVLNIPSLYALQAVLSLLDQDTRGMKEERAALISSGQLEGTKLENITMLLL